MKKIAGILFAFFTFIFIVVFNNTNISALGGIYNKIDVVEFTYDFIDETNTDLDYKTIQTFYDSSFNGIRIAYYGTCKTDEFESYKYTYDLDTGTITNVNITNQHTSEKKDCSDKTLKKSYRSLEFVSKTNHYSLSIDQLIALTKTINLPNIVNEYATYNNDLFEFTNFMIMVDYYRDDQYTYITLHNKVVQLNELDFRVLYSYSNGEETYLGYSQEDLDAAYEKGKNSVDITSDNQEVYNKGFTDGQTSVDITSNDEEIWNEAYQEGSDDGYTLGFEAGKDSIDLESIKQEEYNRGYNNGYNTGFAEGESSVDITSDNDTVIDAYITINKYHTDVEFNLNYEKGYNAGINFVYGNLGSDTVVNKYVTEYITEHKYHTDTEYIDNYEQGYDDGYDIGYNKGINDGKEVIYKNVASDPVVKEYWKTKLVNGTTINIINEGNEVVEVVKKYNVNYDSDDDLIINIHNGQDKYHVETVEEVIPGVSTTKEKIVFDYDLLKKAIIVVTASALGVIILVIIGSFLFTPRRKIKTHRKAGNGYVWSR